MIANRQEAASTSSTCISRYNMMFLPFSNKNQLKFTFVFLLAQRCSILDSDLPKVFRYFLDSTFICMVNNCYYS